jgi:hypothetical protein
MRSHCWFHAFATALAMSLTGCAVQLSQLTTPPPMSTADLNDYDEKIELSPGVAVAFECSYGGSPCTGTTATTDDPKIARVYRAYLDQLVPDYVYRGSMTHNVGFVIVGVSAGTTLLRLSGEASDEYAVTVTDAR